MARIEYLRHKKVNAAVDDGVSEVQPKDWNDDSHDQKGIQGYDDVIKTLVAGAFTFADTLQIIAAETGVTDDLDALTATDALVNDLAIIKADTGDTITVKSGTGNILLPGGIDIIIDATIKQHLILIYDGTNWKLPKVIGNAIVDDNDNEVIELGKIASAVNHLIVQNAATGNDPVLKPGGGDANVDLELQGKGTGFPKATDIRIVTIRDVNGNENIAFGIVASAVNHLKVINAATGNPAELQAVGDDTDIDILLTPKGVGVTRGHRESYGFALSDEDTVLTTGVKITTIIVPYDFNIDDVMISLKTAGTGAALVTVDILREISENSNTFETIFTTKPTIDATEFTSKTAATQRVIDGAKDDILKGERIQLKIDTVDTDNVATGLKVIIAGHALAR